MRRQTRNGSRLRSEVRERHREEQERGGDPEPDSERPVARLEGDHELDDRDRDDTVGEQRESVEREEHAGEDRQEAVHLLDCEARPGELRAGRHEHPEHDRRREEQVRDDPRRAGDVPGEGGQAAASSGTLPDQLPFVATAPSRSTNRPGSPRSSSQAGPASPRSSAALAATSAARQVGAATVTSRQRACDGSPLAGSIRWCWSRPPRSQERCATLLVARPPRSRVTVCPARQADHDRAGRREVAAGRDPALAEQRERVVDRPALDDAVQIEDERLDAEEDPAAQDHRVERGHRRRLDRSAVRGEQREVAVVAGGEHCATDGGGDKTAGGVSGVECEGEHRCQFLRDDRHAAGDGVDAIELGRFDETAEAAVTLVEQPAHTVEPARRATAARRSPSSGTRSRPGALDDGWARRRAPG